jgi:hypothetical protein
MKKAYLCLLKWSTRDSRFIVYSQMKDLALNKLDCLPRAGLIEARSFHCMSDVAEILKLHKKSFTTFDFFAQKVFLSFSFSTL